MRPIKFFLIALVSQTSLLVQADQFRQTTRFSPNDYLMRSVDQHQDSVFDQYRTIDLGASIGVGSDCGKINFTSTLNASLKNLLDTKYFAGIGQNIIGSSPMLLACYFSPTWCAILKHGQVGAHYLAQMRLNQCSVIDKFVDSRVEDFYKERQSCVRKAIENDGGDLEHAMESCQGNSLWNQNLANWSGARNGEKVSQNKLLEASAKWAGLDGAEARPVLDLVKAFVGDTVVSNGNVSVEYGTRQSALTPRTYLQSLEKGTEERLCGGILRKVENAGDDIGVERLVTDEELKSLSPGFNFALIDRQTIRALAVMPQRQRREACKNLSDALSMTMFSSDVNRSLDVLTTLSQNPNLPPNRKLEIEQKRQALKDSVDMAVTLQRQKNTPLKTALSQINAQGQQLQNEMVGAALSIDTENQANQKVRSDFMNCADGVMCDGGN
jgi:hypothetical protein